MAEVWEDDNDLVGVAEGGDQGADCGTVAQVVEELDLVEDSLGGRGHVDLLDGYELGPSAGLGGLVVGSG